MSLKLKNLAAGIILACVLAVFGPLGQMTAYAENTRIAFSDPSVMVGNEVTVTVKVTSDSDLEKAMVMLAYDPEALKFISGTGANGDAGAVKLQGSSDTAGQKALNFSLKFKAVKAGDTQITVTSQEIYDGDSKLLTVDKQGSSSVKVTSPATYSKDATLKSLKISPGELTPEFSPSVEDYTAGVDGSTQDLVVNAVAANAGATVSLEGDKGLKAGDNRVVVTVKAEDGATVKKYTILVTKSEAAGQAAGGSQAGEASQAIASGVTVVINGKQYKAASSFDASLLPEGFEAEDRELKGTSVMAGKGLEKALTLFYLLDENGKGAFYIYNEKDDSWSPYAELQTGSKAIVIVPLAGDVKIPAGFVKRVIQLSGTNVTGWIPESESVKGAEPVHCLFYGMNWNGEEGFYLYDKSESTLQRYFVNQSAFTGYRVQRYLLIGVSVLAVLMLIALILLILKGRGKDGRGPGRGRREVFGDPEAQGDFLDRQDIRSSRVRQYTRQEYEEGKGAGNYEAGFQTGRTKAPEGGEPDDFEMEASLEALESKLASRPSVEVQTEDSPAAEPAGPQEALYAPGGTADSDAPGRREEDGLTEASGKPEYVTERKAGDESLPSTIIKEHRKEAAGQSGHHLQTGMKQEKEVRTEKAVQDTAEDSGGDFEIMDLDT